MKALLLIILSALIGFCTPAIQPEKKIILPGAHRTELYIDLLKNKRVAVVANQGSLIEGVHLVDSLVSAGIDICKIFSPEHGFRGEAEAGEFIAGGKDPVTGISIISLYGKNQKPLNEDMIGVDILIFDLQDVGVRFYTYISTLHYVMEACAENSIEMILLDRPNPNCDYVDGPVMKDEFRSFVGMHPVPVVYGMTIGEYARMINGEGWLRDGIKCKLRPVDCSGYKRNSIYHLPVSPSPNLPSYQSVRLYPSLCFFEGTDISIGRGTDFPFSVYGHPAFDSSLFSFTPVSRPGFSLNPKHMDRTCFGFDLSDIAVTPGEISSINLQWLIDAYTLFPEKEKFFNSYFRSLAGNDELQKQIESGLTQSDIKKSWETGLIEFKKTRQKYLVYP